MSGEFLGVNPVERFDPEGSKKDLKGSGDRMTSRERRRLRAGNGLAAMNSPGTGFETGPSEGVLSRTSLRSDSGAEAKAQVGSVDLVMAAKASLRASERPFRVSGSGRMQARSTCLMH